MGSSRHFLSCFYNRVSETDFIFSSVAFGGIFWWLGFLFAPRVLVAVLATLHYSDSNPFLVLISWFVAISGESTEKYSLRKSVRVGYQRPTKKSSLNEGEVLDADFKRIE